MTINNFLKINQYKLQMYQTCYQVIVDMTVEDATKQSGCFSGKFLTTNHLEVHSSRQRFHACKMIRPIHDQCLHLQFFPMCNNAKKEPVIRS